MGAVDINPHLHKICRISTELFFPVYKSTQTCFWDCLEVRFEDCSIPLSTEGEGDQHHIPRGHQLHNGGRTRNRQPTPPETSECIQDTYIIHIIEPCITEIKISGVVVTVTPEKNMSLPGDDLVL